VKTIIVNVENHIGTLQLGRVGENNARQIVFDCSAFEQIYGNGTAQVSARLPTGEKYPVSVEQTDSAVVWTVSAADVGAAGTGQAELSWIVNDIIAKTQIFRTSIVKSLTGTETPEPPSPYQDWVDRVEAVGEQAQQAVETATQEAEAAAEAAVAVVEVKQKLDTLMNLGPFLGFAEEGQ
jgi:hypothetical protein